MGDAFSYKMSADGKQIDMMMGEIVAGRHKFIRVHSASEGVYYGAGMGAPTEWVLTLFEGDAAKDATYGSLLFKFK